MERIRLGMVGGGENAMIGSAHRLASRIDDRYHLIAGALSSDPERAKRSAKQCGIERSYTDFTIMAKEEGSRADGIEAVAIVTPNHLHCNVAKLFIEQGIHVICDKPLSHSSQEALEFAKFLRKHPQTHFILTHNYSAYPLVRQMRYMVAEGMLGDIQRINGRYLQDWRRYTTQAKAWRNDPHRTGKVGCAADIGSHLAHLVEFILQDRIASVNARLDNFCGGGELDDDAQLLIRMRSGVHGMLWVSQVSIGRLCDLNIAIYGSKASVKWQQEEPNTLIYTALGKPTQLIKRNSVANHWASSLACRIAPGHPEGYFEAFAEIYRETADKIQGRENPLLDCLPGIEDGLSGMALFEATYDSHHGGNVWTELPLWSEQLQYNAS